MPYVDATPLPPDLALEPWDDAAARWRLDRLRDALPVRIPADAVFSTGASNDVWIFGETVLRVCWRGDRDRLLREAALTAVLPPGVPHATVLGSGRTDDVGWTLSEFIPGTPMDQVVERSPVGDARELFGRYAEILATLNDWAPPAETSALMDDRPSIRADDLLSTWASDLMPFPLERALTMIDLAREVPHLDPSLLDATRDRLVELAPFDPFAAGDTTPRSIVHARRDPWQPARPRRPHRRPARLRMGTLGAARPRTPVDRPDGPAGTGAHTSKPAPGPPRADLARRGLPAPVRPSAPRRAALGQ